MFFSEHLKHPLKQTMEVDSNPCWWKKSVFQAGQSTSTMIGKEGRVLHRSPVWACQEDPRPYQLRLELYKCWIHHKKEEICTL